MLVLMEKYDIKARSVQARDVAKWGPYIYSLQKKTGVRYERPW